MQSLSGINILYVCNQDRATTKQRLLALEELDVTPDIVYTYLLDEKISFLKRLKRSVLFRLRFFPERNHENQAIRVKVSQNHYDIVFIEKGLSIKSSTLKFIKKNQPSAKIISYTLDDVMNKHNSSFYYRKSLPLYDFHFTNKKYNVSELKHLGAKNVYYFRNAYSTHVHKPILLEFEEVEKYGADVSFVGTFEPERAEIIRYLADNGVNIRVRGWSKSATSSNMIHPKIDLTKECVYDEKYAKVIGASKINLCFLRKANRDTETTRSIEIPACEGFMLAERTAEHLELFEEGVEAAYFASREELLEKIKYYLINDNERIQIAKNGLSKCISLKISYQDQLSSILTTVLSKKNNH